jgi:hypothetical protein
MAASIINLKAVARFGPQCREALVRHFEPFDAAAAPNNFREMTENLASPRGPAAQAA